MGNYPKRKILDTIPTYIPGKSIESLRKEYGLAKIVKLASNENPLGTAVTDFSQLECAQYYPDCANNSLLTRLASHLTVTESNLILGNGSDELIQLLALAFLNPGDAVITSETTFSEYQFSATLMDAETVTVPMTKNTYDITQIKEAITPKTKLIFIANPNNPTGTILTHNDILEILNSIPKEIILVLDEAYAEYVESPDYPSSIDLIPTHPNLVVLRTFSKLYGLAAFRIGYAVANPELVRLLFKVKAPFNVNGLAIRAAELALDNRSFVEESLRINREGKAFLYKELSKLGLNYQESEANFIYIDVPVSGNDLFEELLKLGLIIRPLASFGRLNAIRVTVGTQEDNQFFIDCLKKGLECLKQ